MTERQQHFLNLFEPVRERLWRFVRAMVFRWDNRDAELANDIMSETVLQVLERFDTLRDEKAFLSFCFTIANRIHKAHLVRRKYWKDSDAHEQENLLSDSVAPDVQTDIHLLYNALDALPDKTKEAVVLFELSDLSLEEIRQIQGGTLSGVKSRVTRGREQLAELLGESKKKRSNVNGTLMTEIF
jgi:RNA polymerase sigma-70 factor (ECF subfamily)